MIRRSIAKAVKDYDRFTESKGNNTGAFWASDIQEVKELATNPMGGVELFTAIVTGLKAGYMIGYRTAQRHLAQKI